jgi:AbrB family looped-hinge helix DNA binding protein
MATVTRKGQVTIPKVVREALGLGPGAKVVFEIREGEAVLRRRAPVEALDNWYGRLKHLGKTTDEIMEELRGE